MNTATKELAGGGVIDSMLVFGGSPPSSPSYSARTETWNGSSWMETNDLNTARAFLNGAGANNSLGLAIGGYVGPPGNTAATEEFTKPSFTTRTIDTD